jgi:hypothetical protein
LQVLDRIGPTQFIKLTSRGSKMAYKGDIIHLIARFFLHVPTWMLYLIVALGAVVWVPWGRLRRLGHWLRTKTPLTSRAVAETSNRP